MFCPNCGSNNPDTATTCTQCNTALNKPAGGGGPKFKGTMLMMNQPGAPLPAPGGAGAAAPKPAGGPPSAGAAPPAASKLKGTMVGVAPPVAGAAPAPAAPVPTPAPMPAPDHQTFGSGAGVNPLGGTMVADAPGGGGFGGGFGAPPPAAPPPADPFAPAGGGAPPPAMGGAPMGGAPPPMGGGADPFGPPGGGYGAPMGGAPAPMGAPPAPGMGGADAYGGAPPGAMGAPPAPGMGGAPPGGYGAAPPPQDFGGQVQQGFNQMGNAFGQAANEMSGAMGMTPYGAQPGGQMMGGMPGQMMAGGVSDKTHNLTLILAIVPTFFGFFGIHRFYTGHIGIGIAQFLTAGGCGIWQIIDIIMIFTGKYTDKQGRPLLKQ